MLVTGRYREHSHIYDDAFDKEFNVETRGSERLEYLTADPLVRAHGRGYEAVSVKQMAVLMGKLPSLDLTGFTFIDLGSGKGRALFIASTFPFRRIIGVEYAQQLHELAVRNIATLRNPAQRCFDITSICADATKYSFPLEPTICFMNNPFDEMLIASMAENLTSGLRNAPREFFLIYLHANHTGAMDRVASWKRLDAGVIAPASPYVVYRWCPEGS
jgi:SAM-dependent methyltransferase